MMENNKIVVRTRAVIFYKDKLLVVKHSSASDFYALPGGHLEWGEDIKESLSREIVEELGVTPQIGRLLFINNFKEKDIQSIEFFFEVINGDDYLVVENLKGTHSYELSEIYWTSVDEDKKILPSQIMIHLKNQTIISDVVRFLQ